MPSSPGLGFGVSGLNQCHRRTHIYARTCIYRICTHAGMRARAHTHTHSLRCYTHGMHKPLNAWYQHCLTGTTGISCVTSVTVPTLPHRHNGYIVRYICNGTNIVSQAQRVYRQHQAAGERRSRHRRHPSGVIPARRLRCPPRSVGRYGAPLYPKHKTRNPKPEIETRNPKPATGRVGYPARSVGRCGAVSLRSCSSLFPSLTHRICRCLCAPCQEQLSVGLGFSRCLFTPREEQYQMLAGL
jgi:hypothetical protein